MGLGSALVLFFEATSKLRKAAGLLKPQPAWKGSPKHRAMSCLQDDEGLEKLELNRLQRIKDGNYRQGRNKGWSTGGEY